MKNLGSRTLETDRLILRATIESDLKTLWEILCIPEVNRYYLVGKFNTDWEKEKVWQYKKLEHANDLDVYVRSIVLKDNNKCIGQISAQESGENKSIRDVGWFINPDYQRKGYSYEATSRMINYMFDEVNINKIETSVAQCNDASWRLMEKLGFVRTEKTCVHHYTFGEIVDGYCYNFSKEQYTKVMKLQR